MLLIKPDEAHIEAIRDYRREMLSHNSPFDGCGGLQDFEDIAAWVTHCRLYEREETKPNPAFVTGTQFMLMRNGRVLGMLALRHELNDFWRKPGDILVILCGRRNAERATRRPCSRLRWTNAAGGALRGCCSLATTTTPAAIRPSRPAAGSSSA